jgi:hypothetical protein
VRVAPSMKPQEVANSLWALATLGWPAGEGSMRCALEGAAVRVAPSMKPQEVANSLWGLATLGWQDVSGVGLPTQPGRPSAGPGLHHRTFIQGACGLTPGHSRRIRTLRSGPAKRELPSNLSLLVA